MSTKIAYCDETWNPIIGCPLPLCSVGCTNCWARESHNMRHKAYLEGKLQNNPMYAKPFEQIQFFPERLEQPMHWKKPRTIFVGSQTDLFHKSIPFELIDKIFGIMCGGDWHTYLLLTKHPERMEIFFKNRPSPYWSGILRGKYKKTKVWPFDFIHVWLGTTICTQPEADENIPLILQIPAAKRWISIEPCLNEIVVPKNRLKELSWCVIGCESGSKSRPCKIEWIRSIVQQCKAAGVKLFIKQLEINGKVSHKMSEWPEDLRIQEYPENI